MKLFIIRSYYVYFFKTQVKKELTAQGDESVSNDIVGQAHLENVTVNLFSWADSNDRNAIFNKYTCYFLIFTFLCKITFLAEHKVFLSLFDHLENNQYFCNIKNTIYS